MITCLQFLALPYALLNPNVSTVVDQSENPWFGEIKDYEIGTWIDVAFLLLLGGIPWQCYYQRVLSSKTSMRAVVLSYGGGLIALIMTGPSVR